MFRRNKSEAAEAIAPVKEGGKGRPTPTRKEAEAAARERAKVPRTRKEMSKHQRLAKTENSRKVRAAMKSGDEIVITQLDHEANTVLFGTLLLVIIDLLLMRFRLRRQLATRFPDEPLKGTTYYAITRSMQMKFMRLPKAQVKIGQQLPDTYR